MAPVLKDGAAIVMRQWRGYLLATLGIAAAVYAGTMTPWWMLVVLGIINLGIGVCYRLLPDYLSRDAMGIGTVISANLEGHFSDFIRSCGDHHQWHYPAMMAMMAGAMDVSHGHADWTGYALLWGGFLSTLFLDSRNLWVSVRAAVAFRLEKGL